MAKAKPLGTEERLAHGGATHVAVITHEDLTETTANTAQTIELMDVANKVAVECVYTDLVTPFEDASDAAFNTNTLIVGDGGDTDRLLASQEMNENGTEVDMKVGTGTNYVYTGADTVDAVIGSMTAKSLSNIDTGEVRIYLKVIDAS